MRTLSALPMFGIVVGRFVGCTYEETHEDVSSQPMYSKLIGDRYEILQPLHAYGVRRHSEAPVRYITLMPPPGIEGSEIGFDVAVQPAAIIEILKVVKTNRWPDPNMTLIVGLEGAPVPVDKPIRVDLFRGNEGDGTALLNPAIYRKLDRRPETDR